MVKGAALFLQQGSSPQGQRSLQHPHKHAGDGSKLTLLPWDLFSGQQRNPPLLVASTLLVFKAREIVERRFVMTGAGRGSRAGHARLPDGTGSQRPFDHGVYVRRSAAFCLDIKISYSVYQLTADFKLQYDFLTNAPERLIARCGPLENNHPGVLDA